EVYPRRRRDSDAPDADPNPPLSPRWTIMFEPIVGAIRAISRRRPPLATLCLALLLSAPAHVAKSQTAADSAATPAAPAAPAPGTPPPDVTQAAAQAAGGTITATQADSLPDSDGGWPRLIPCPSGATMIL